uniref:Uncharacterized protein n=1 Tax=Glossina pallidipes TaxID=7398 RepID=A0A1B0AEL7_GLOPL
MQMNQNCPLTKKRSKEGKRKKEKKKKKGNKGTILRSTTLVTTDRRQTSGKSAPNQHQIVLYILIKMPPKKQCQ